jgi:uncharacterized protein YeaC (DUF1315 family)
MNPATAMAKEQEEQCLKARVLLLENKVNDLEAELAAMREQKQGVFTAKELLVNGLVSAQEIVKLENLFQYGRIRREEERRTAEAVTTTTDLTMV